MEVEVKFPYREGVEEKVRRMADFVIEKFEHDLYFNHPCRDFRESDEAVRVRKDSEGVTMTYKGPKVDTETKSREEIKLKVNSFENAVEMLGRLGFIPVKEVKKMRKIYRYGNALICLDNVEGLGKFVEIEIEAESIDAKEELFRIAAILGYSRDECLRESYLEMILKNNPE